MTVSLLAGCAGTQGPPLRTAATHAPSKRTAPPSADATRASGGEASERATRESFRVAPLPMPSPAAVKAFLVARFGQDMAPAEKRAFLANAPAPRLSIVDPGAVLRRHRVFGACTDTFRLDSTMPPMRASCGYFATDGKAFWYLSGEKKQSLEALLRRDGTRLDDQSAAGMGTFFATLLLASGSDSSVVVDSWRVLLGLDDGEFLLDPAQQDKYVGKVQPPAVSRTKSGGWAFHFCTLSGWMHNTKTLRRHRIVVEADHTITRSSRVLSDAVLSRVPDIVY